MFTAVTEGLFDSWVVTLKNVLEGIMAVTHLAVLWELSAQLLYLSLITCWIKPMIESVCVINLNHQKSPLTSSPASVSVKVGRVDGPGLHRSLAEQRVEHGSKQVDGSSDVENYLPFF